MVLMKSCHQPRHETEEGMASLEEEEVKEELVEVEVEVEAGGEVETIESLCQYSTTTAALLLIEFESLRIIL